MYLQSVWYSLPAMTSIVQGFYSFCLDASFLPVAFVSENRDKKGVCKITY